VWQVDLAPLTDGEHPGTHPIDVQLVRRIGNGAT
jgi:hypothetical protein